jgi:hypothetical protein
VKVENGLGKTAPIKVPRANEQNLFCHFVGIA